MGVWKRGNSWYASWYEGEKGNKSQKKKAFKLKRDAVAYEGKMKAALRENRLFDIKKDYSYTFDELLERYIKVHKNQKSFPAKKNHFPLFIQPFGGKLLGNITPDQLELFRNDRLATPVKSGVDKLGPGCIQREKNPKPRRPRSKTTVNRELSTLRHMFSKAEEWGMMESSPFGKVKLFFKENNERIRYLTRDEAKNLLSVCSGYMRDIVIVALCTGMRRGEILSLKWSQIREGFIYLTQTKSDNARQIPLNQTLIELLATLPRHLKSEYIFVNPKTGTRYIDTSNGFNATVERAGIVDFHFHDLRHTFASWLVMAGKPLKVVQELLGHKDIKTTMRYAHLADEQLIEGVAAVDLLCLNGGKNKYKTSTGIKKGTRKSLQVPDKSGEPRGGRTHDLRIKSPLLYQLS